MTSQLFRSDIGEAIEKELDTYFMQSIADAGNINTSYKLLWQTLHDLIRAGGKRFRPNMTMLAYEIFGGQEAKKIVPIATAQELLHFSLLIHDDIIDRDYVRYGVPNIAGTYASIYQQYMPDKNETLHFANSTAILGGDLILSGAYALIMKSDATDHQKHTAHALLTQSIFDVAGGELLDTEASFTPYTPGDALTIALYKTARYSFVIPLLTGAKLAGCTSAQEGEIRRYAEALGIAYQLVDDLLGVFGAEEQTGKSVLSDIREGKRTYMVECAMRAMNDETTAAFNRAFGNPDASSEAITSVKELLISSGAKAETEAMIESYRADARDAVTQLGLDESAAEKLRQLSDIVIKRVS